jgi:hypothetical protein
VYRDCEGWEEPAGASVKRTDFDSLEVFWAEVKSAASEESLGCVRVEEVPRIGVLLNWEESSSYCSFMRARCSAVLGWWLDFYM